MFQKNSSILSFELKRIFLNSLLILFIAACGFKPLNYSEKKITIFFEFQKNPLNFSLVQELKKNFFLMNANLAETKNDADFVIEISNHRLGKFLEATDENFFPAVASLDYQVKLSIFEKNTTKVFSKKYNEGIFEKKTPRCIVASWGFSVMCEAQGIFEKYHCIFSASFWKIPRGIS